MIENDVKGKVNQLFYLLKEDIPLTHVPETAAINPGGPHTSISVSEDGAGIVFATISLLVKGREKG